MSVACIKKLPFVSIRENMVPNLAWLWRRVPALKIAIDDPSAQLGLPMVTVVWLPVVAVEAGHIRI